MNARESNSKPYALARLIAVLVFVGSLSWSLREILHLRVFAPGEAEWTTFDPDGMYHMRRVEQVLKEGLPIAAHDALLNHPDGARVPWPPYYTYALSLIAAPMAPDDVDHRRLFIEHLVASVPHWLGVLTSLLVALCGYLLAKNAGALLAGSYHALCFGSIAYSKAGVADHHAWTTFWLAAGLLILTWSLRAQVDRQRKSASLAGLALGVVAGILLGSWVASLVFILILQAVMAWMLWDNARDARPGTAAFGLAFHLGALLTVLPAVLHSPWKEEFPWMVVNLSWFHLAHLALGGLVFLPLAFLASSSGVNKRYPWLVALGLILLAGILVVTGSPPWVGIQEGFSWASRADEFMATIHESLPLLGIECQNAKQGFAYLGYGLLFLPILLLWSAARAWHPEQAMLRPWFIALAVLGLMGFAQLRFTDPLSVPLSVLLGWCLVQVWRLPAFKQARKLPAAFPFLAVFALPILLQWPTLSRYVKSMQVQGFSGQAVRMPGARANREMLEWIRAQQGVGETSGVLARWSHGHAIEWIAGQASVATNFGSYVGQEGFLFPQRFFMKSDPVEAQRALEDRDVRWVMITSQFPKELSQILENLPEAERGRYMRTGQADGRPTQSLTAAWYSTMGARLMFRGSVRGALGQSAEPLRFLRLSHISPKLDRNPGLKALGSRSPRGWVWERVPGALIEASGTPGEVLQVELELEWPGVAEPLIYRDRATVDANGLAQLRLPYATDGSNGDARLRGTPRWRLGEQSGELRVPGSAVTSGSSTKLN